MSRAPTALAVVLVGCATLPPPPRSAARSEDDPPQAARASALEQEPPKLSMRGWLGALVIAPQDLEGGVLVDAVQRGSPAERAGIARGDRILKLDGAPVIAPGDVERIAGSREPGARVAIIVRRGAAERLLAAELAPVPDEGGAMRLSFVDAHAPRLESLETVQGSLEPTLSGLKGKVVVLEFWAPWCSACRFLVPKMNEWHARYSAEGVVVLGITMDAVVPATHAATQLGISYPVASDHSGKTTRAYRANALPALFVIDKQGVVRDVLVGYSAERLAELERRVQSLAGEG